MDATKKTHTIGPFVCLLYQRKRVDSIVARKKSIELKGYISKIGKGLYRLRASFGYKSNGQPKWIGSENVDAKNEREAYRLLEDWLEQFEGLTSETLDFADITFEDFYTKVWLKEGAEGLSLEPKTFHNYKQTIELRFLTPLGLLKLVDIKPFQIKQIITKSVRLKPDGTPNPDGKPLTRATKQRMLFAINNLFLLAKNEYTIIKNNPCDMITLPKAKGEKKNVEEPYSEEEIERFLKAAFGEELHLKTLLLAAFVTGAREGELAGLEEKDIDFEDLTIRFHQRVSEIDGKSVVLRPGLKNDDEEKIVTIPQFLADFLKELIARNKKSRWKLGIKKPTHYFIFDNVLDGTTLPRPSYMYKKFKRFTRRHSLRHIRFHDIRHTSATYWLNDPEMTTTEVQHRLGHRSQSTTTNIYGHVLKKKKDRATEMMEGLKDHIESKESLPKIN